MISQISQIYCILESATNLKKTHKAINKKEVQCVYLTFT